MAKSLHSKGKPIASSRKPLSVAQAKRLTQKNPNETESWKQLGLACIRNSQNEEALRALEHASSLNDSDAEIHAWLSMVYNAVNRLTLAKESAEKALTIDPYNVKALTQLARIEFDSSRFSKALSYLEKAEQYEPNNEVLIFTKGKALGAMSRYDEAQALFQKLVQRDPNNLHYWNELGIVQRDLGDLKEAERSFRKAMTCGSSPIPFANLITGIHYDPAQRHDAIAAICREWQGRFGVKSPPSRPVPKDLTPSRQLRIGLLSDGFRQHPVGNMVIEALENTSPQEAEFYFYTTNLSSDPLTKRFRKLASRWLDVKYTSDEEFAQQVRNDEIDILFDLAGHNAGTRSRAISMQPAPLIVKWVGGLINTTGVEAIDYLISDHIETPEVEDAHYTEKLIRMPDDYIVYARPLLVPSLASLPAKKNGYITLGCFNNPTKLNGELFSHWANIMQQLPNSRLLLKGKPYTSEEFCERIYNHFEQVGIERDRLILEGPSPHHKFLAAYNRVDIALDTWPYSGGLTTCEAFLMGVPVVSLPGPTFAGRHSATHLVNAGMPELVVNSWEEYQERVLELASDLDSLSTIRQHLRDVLLQSPVCDGPRFAKHFMRAMRAIWQRYCEGKAPEALSFNKQGELWFEDDKQVLDIKVDETPRISNAKVSQQKHSFSWKLQGKLIGIDNGASLVKQPAVQEMLKHKSLELITFDPAGELSNDAAKSAEGVHYYSGALLGNGEAATLYATLDPANTATLLPLESASLPNAVRRANKVLTQLPVATLALDSIEGLPALDWLVLDAHHDANTILENGEQTLKNALLLDITVAFQLTHERQPNLAELQHWASRNGFRFYRLNTPQHISHLPESVPAEKRQATELASANALFLPSHERMAALSHEQSMKLAFLLHTVYGIKDMAYALLAQVSEEEAEGYLVEEGLANKMKKPAVKREVIYDPSQLECNQREFTLCVGVPVYNEEKYIRETIQSLKNQDFGDVKFLIADNCSTDNTLNIICEEVIGDDRFEIFQHQGNVGAAGNFEFAFKNSQSKYFMWLGGHDFLSDSYLSTTIKSMGRDSGVSMVMGKPVAVAENSKEIGFLESGVYDFSDDKKENRYLKSVAELSNCTVVHAIFLREALEDFEFRRTLSPDHVLISHLLWHGKLKNLSNVFYYRRFFGERKESQDERITGRPVKLERKDFFDYYLDDLRRLSKDSNSLIRKKLIESVDNTLRARFD